MRTFQRKAGPTVPAQARPSNESGKLRGLQRHRAVDVDLRVEIGLRDADLGVLGRHQPFGTSHVGTPPQEVGGNPYSDAFRYRRHRFRAVQQVIQIVRRHPQQNGQAVPGSPPRKLECFHRGERAGQARFGLRGIDLAVDHRDLEACLGDPRAFLLHDGVALGECQSLVQCSQLDIGARDFRDQQHECIVIVFDRTVESCVSGFHRAAKAAPEVELPRQAASQPPVAERAEPRDRPVRAGFPGERSPSSGSVESGRNPRTAVATGETDFRPRCPARPVPPRFESQPPGAKCSARRRPR